MFAGAELCVCVCVCVCPAGGTGGVTGRPMCAGAELCVCARQVALAASLWERGLLVAKESILEEQEGE